MRIGNKGQMNTMNTIFAVIAVIAGLSICAVVLAAFFPASETATNVTKIYPYATLNSSMSDNTHGVPNYWENVYYDNRIAVLDNYGITNHFLQDNDNGCCFWYQTMTLPAYDSILSATISFKYQLSDNSGLLAAGAKENLVVFLGRPGGDNVLVWDNLSWIAADNTTWHSQDNDVTSKINAAGTYTLYLYDNAVTVGNAVNDNVVVRWDDASLTINVENITSKSANSVLGGIENMGWASIGLMAVGIIVLAAFVIVILVRRMGGVSV